MATLGYWRLGPDRSTGVFQLAPTDFQGGDPADFYRHVFLQRQSHLMTTGQFSMSQRDWPETTIEHCTVRTEYRPLYRIHGKDGLHLGQNYYSMWKANEWNTSKHYRFSPPGTTKFYFGLTLRAAENEVKGLSPLPTGDSHLILVLEACLDNVLNLTAGCIEAVWKAVGLPSVDTAAEMYLRMLAPATANPTADAIGTWARKRGFAGLIVPSARYEDEEWIAQRKAEGHQLVPIINYVEMGTHLCHTDIPQLHAAITTDTAVEMGGGVEKVIPVWTEPNLLLFDGDQVSGRDWGVVYQTFPLAGGEEAKAQDDATRQTRSFFYSATEKLPGWLPTSKGSE